MFVLSLKPSAFGTTIRQLAEKKMPNEFVFPKELSQDEAVFWAEHIVGTLFPTNPPVAMNDFQIIQVEDGKDGGKRRIIVDNIQVCCMDVKKRHAAYFDALATANAADQHSIGWVDRDFHILRNMGVKVTRPGAIAVLKVAGDDVNKALAFTRIVDLTAVKTWWQMKYGPKTK